MSAWIYVMRDPDGVVHRVSEESFGEILAGLERRFKDLERPISVRAERGGDREVRDRADDYRS